MVISDTSAVRDRANAAEELLSQSVLDMLKAGEPMPLFMAKDKIVRILINRRHGEIIRQNEERIRQNAENNGLIKIYRDSTDIN